MGIEFNPALSALASNLAVSSVETAQRADMKFNNLIGDGPEFNEIGLLGVTLPNSTPTGNRVTLEGTQNRAAQLFNFLNSPEGRILAELGA